MHEQQQVQCGRVRETHLAGVQDEHWTRGGCRLHGLAQRGQGAHVEVAAGDDDPTALPRLLGFGDNRWVGCEATGFGRDVGIDLVHSSVAVLEDAVLEDAVLVVEFGEPLS